MLKKLLSFDGTESTYSNFERPERYNELFNLITRSKKMIARGAGLSYCNASAGNDITSISTLRFNRILEFDKANGIITVEPGLNLGEFLSFILANGWYFPVLPGYPSITIGGCVAFNVHGKTQYNVGNFSDYIVELNIFHPSHGEIKCNSNNNKELLELTIGGLGLTGFITKVKLKLTPLKVQSLILRKQEVANLIEAVDLMKTLSAETDIIYSWNNLNKKGVNFGKGVVYTEIYSQEHIARNSHFKNLTPENRSLFKINYLNRLTTSIMCRGFYLKEGLTNSEKRIDLLNGSFPIVGKEIYYILFGKRGLREYQMIIPYSKWGNFVIRLEKIISSLKIPVSLGSLKLFCGEPRYLNFSGNGVCLAIDVPASNKSLIFFNTLDELVIENEGIANLSKDSRIQSDVVARMYPEFKAFKETLNNFDPDHHFTSSLRKRIKV